MFFLVSEFMDRTLPRQADFFDNTTGTVEVRQSRDGNMTTIDFAQVRYSVWPSSYPPLLTVAGCVSSCS